jgi:hypothetical protein
MSTDSKDINGRFYSCEFCEDVNFDVGAKYYTYEELRAHVPVAHPDWGVCKGCMEFITKSELEKEKGWCELCVYRCLDCMDTEKYPEEPP